MNCYELVSRIRPIELAELIKRIWNPKRVITEGEGCRFAVDPLTNFGRRLLTDGQYEPDMTAAMIGLLREGDTFIDAGANEGWFSVIAARAVGSSGLAIAIEPQERCWSAIHRNFSINRMLNYRLIPYALGDCEGEIEMTLYPSLNNEASSLVSQRRSRHFARQKTQLIRLDSVVNALGIAFVKLLKIDCEGYELNLLRGGESLLAKGIVDHVLVEIHPAQLAALGQREGELTDYLESFGYRTSKAGPLSVWSHGRRN